MNNDMFKTMLKKASLTKKSFAGHIGTSSEAVNNWNNKSREIPYWVESWLTIYIKNKKCDELKKAISNALGDNDITESKTSNNEINPETNKVIDAFIKAMDNVIEEKSFQSIETLNYNKMRLKFESRKAQLIWSHTDKHYSGAGAFSGGGKGPSILQTYRDDIIEVLNTLRTEQIRTL